MSEQLNGKIYLQKLQTNAYLSLGIPLLFFIYIYLESSVDELKEKVPADYHTHILILIVVICLLIIFWGIKKYKVSIKQSLSEKELKTKLDLYRSANSNRFLIYGLSSALISIGFYITNYQPFAALFGIMIVLFSINNPNTRKIIRELNLKNKNKEIILNGLKIP